MEFYVTSRPAVRDFKIGVTVDGCGQYIIRRTTEVVINNNSFNFQGTFQANGTFSSSTRCTGRASLNDFHIEGCGYVSGGPWSYTANWKHAAVAANERGEVAANTGEGDRGFYVAAESVSQEPIPTAR